jgi:hypothetical protein
MAAHTYENAYKLIRDVRVELNEFSANLWTGSDTSGKFDNTYIIDKINAAQARIYALMMKTEAKEIFQTSTTIVGSSSVYTLPADFGKVIQFEDPDGLKVFPSNAKVLPRPGETGSDRLYYRKGNTFVLNKSGVSDTYTLKYYKRPRRLTWGVAAASSGLNDLRLADTDITNRTDDYYNGFIVDNYTQAKSGTISDYAGSTRSATTGGSITWAASTDYYGTVSDLPFETHIHIAPLAVILVKAAHPAAQERPTKAEMDLWASMFLETMVAFTNQPEDVPIEEVFCDFDPTFGVGSGYSIPGQGYVVY